MPRIINGFFSRLERFLSKNWYNPILSLYVNVRLLPIIQALKQPIIVYGMPRILELSGHAQFKTPVKYGILTINKSHPDAPSYQGNNAELLIRGKIVFNGSGQIDTGSKIYVGANGILELGDNFKITDNVNIGCSKSIKIGHTTRITHRCQVFDSNYHFLANINKGIIPPVIKPIIIGNNVWVGNSTTICGGASIPDTTVITSNSLVNKDFSEIPKYSIIGGIPARHITCGFRRVEDKNLTKELYQYYQLHQDSFKIPASLDDSIYFLN